MARIRTIKPEFWTSEQIASLNHSERLLFIGLWNFSDDRGVHKASPLRLLMEVFPGDDEVSGTDVKQWIERLINVGLVACFEHEEEPYWYVRGWYHQKIDRPSFSRLPPPPSKQSSTSARRALVEHSSREGSLKESKGKEGNSTSPELERKEPEPEPFSLASDPPHSDGERVVLLFPCKGRGPKQWELRESLLAELVECYPRVNVLQQARQALMWCRTNPTDQKTARGMAAFLNRWMERQQNGGGARASPGEAAGGLDLSILDD